MPWLLSFPLLSKELIEQSARKRTYVIRCVYAGLLLVAFAMMYSNIAQNYGYSQLGMIGNGGRLFDTLFYCQYWAVLLLMPALAAGSLTTEKEQGSLTILLLTDLGPWELVLQKWLTRIMIVSSFLLLGTPLMGLCYALGGLEVERLILGIYVLLLTCFQTAAIAIAVSAWCRNSIAALLTTYMVLLIMYLGPMLIAFAYQGLTAATRYTTEVSSLLWPGKMFTAFAYGGRQDLTDLTVSSLPIWIGIGLSLLFARWALPRRAQITGPGPLLRLFRQLDATFERIDAKLGRRAAHVNVPEHSPVAWRELNRRSLANWRYLFRFILPITGIFVALLCFFTAFGDARTVNNFLQITSLSLLGITLLLGLVLGSTLIAAERMQQTLDVLLTTPLTARLIIIEKLRGLRRITWVLIVPALLLIMWVNSIKGITATYYDAQPNLIAPFAYFLLLPPLFTWFAVAIGLFIRSRNRAMIVALIGGCLWLGSTMLFAMTLFGLMGLRETSLATLLIYFTPGMLPLVNELEPSGFKDFVGGAPLMITVFVCWHGGLWLLLRWWCLRNADRLMRRTAAS